MRLPRFIRLAVYLATAATWLSGVAWLLLHHFVRREGPFGPEAHPLEHQSLALHGAAAFLIVWALGLIWTSHIRRGWWQKRNQKNGRAMTLLFLVLILSGWGLYYLGSEDWRDPIAQLHWILGLLLGVWLPLHIWNGRRRHPADE